MVKKLAPLDVWRGTGKCVVWLRSNTGFVTPDGDAAGDVLVHMHYATFPIDRARLWVGDRVEFLAQKLKGEDTYVATYIALLE